MNKNIVLFFCLLFIFVNLHGQNISIGIRGGLTVPNLTGGSGAPLSEGYSTRGAAGFGVFAEFHFSHLFSLQPMIEYSQQGAKKNGMQAFAYDPTAPNIQELMPILEIINGGSAPQYLYADYKSTVKLNYLMLPILAKFGWDLDRQKHWRVYGDIGPYAGWLLNAHQLQQGGVQQIYLDKNGSQPVEYTDPRDPNQTVYKLAAPFDTTENIKPVLHTFNTGFEGNIGFAYRFKNNTFFIEAGGNYGLLNIQKKAEYGRNNSGAVTVMIGYSIKLK